MNPTKLHLFDPISDIGLTPWFETDDTGALVPFLKGDITNPFTHTALVTLAECDAACLPNNIRRPLTEIEQEYVRACADQCEQAGKPLLMFACGDLTDRITFDSRAYVLRYSVYKSEMRASDIVIPTLTNDPLKSTLSIRPKQEVPLVSFCGQGGYQTKTQWLKFYVKTARYQILGLIRPRARARILGVYWRRIMMTACLRSKLVRTNFIIRRSFSGAVRTIELDPEQAHTEFVNSIIESDFVLAPKGDGNYSNRFLEALALGRIPVLLDTDTVLPLENDLIYGPYIVRIPMNDADKTPRYIRAWYDALSEEEWKSIQVRARELFETRLRFDSFFSYFFSSVLPVLPPDACEYRP